MANTHILTQEFEYFEPKTIEEALSLLSAHQEHAKPLAGGTDLLVWMKMGRVHPRVVINIARIPALRFLIEEKGVRMGTLTTFRELEGSALMEKRYTALFEAARAVTSVQIKNMGTLGGNLCNASPAADSAPPLIAFGAKVRLRSEQQERFLPVEDFFVGNGKTALAGNELLIDVQMTEASGPMGSAFIKKARVAADLAKISLACMVVRDGDVLRECRIAMGGVAKTPFRLRRAEAVLRGSSFSLNRVEEAGREAAEEIQPRSRRSTAFYKKEVTKILLRDAMGLAWTRSGGK